MYTVSATQNATVNSVQTAPNALLDVLANFSATDGTGTGANDGAIRIENGHTLTLQGPVTNVGTIELFGTVSPTSIVLGSGGVTLSGGGAIFLNFSGGRYQQIVPSPSGSVLTDVDNRISGQGLLGGAGMTIINEAAGFIEAKAGPLVINTGANTIINAGTIDSEGNPSGFPNPPAQGTVESPVNNSGLIKADGDGSTLTFDDAVTGTGRAVISGGTLRFDSFFSQNVDFERSTGVLALAQSVNYTAVIAQFTTTGGESLDLADIAFVGAGEATYSGTVSSGTLTVTDGTHIARIRLEGNYLGEAFIVSSDGHGGTSVTDGLKALHWLSSINGLFQTAANWTGGLVPGPGSDAILDASGANYTVTASASRAVAGIQTAANAILSVAGGTFTAANGTDGGVNAGRIAVANDSIFTVGGTLDNAGSVTLGASSDHSIIKVTGALTLTGGGEILMSNSTANLIVGSSATATLTNVGNAIVGAGDLGDGELTLINGAAGKIASNSPSAPLVIDTGANTIVNAGRIENSGTGGTIVQSAVANSGSLIAEKGTLTLNGAITGSGDALIYGGTLNFTSSFSQNVGFKALTGVLELAQSQSFAGTVYGFSKTGGTSLDLRDIAFGGSTTATYSGTTTSGVLTVTDGAHTAHINLSGDYLASTFTASSDGKGGTSVIDPPKGAGAPAAASLLQIAPPSPHGFIAAMANLGASPANLIGAALETRHANSPVLATVGRSQFA
jgi:hypothetical protein